MSSPTFLDGLLNGLADRFAPPPWAVHEAQHRLVLLLNHVLMQEPQAMERLRRQSGRTLQGRWRQFDIRLRATPAGLLDLADPAAQADLTLEVTDTSPLAVAQAVLQGRKPAVRIAGDVQFAAEVNWLVDHVRWDLEEDAARVVGDAPAHALGQAVRAMVAALRRFVPGAAAAGSGSARPGPA